MRESGSRQKLQCKGIPPRENAEIILHTLGKRRGRFEDVVDVGQLILIHLWTTKAFVLGEPHELVPPSNEATVGDVKSRILVVITLLAPVREESRRLYL